MKEKLFAIMMATAACESGCGVTLQPYANRFKDPMTEVLSQQTTMDVAAILAQCKDESKTLGDCAYQNDALAIDMAKNFNGRLAFIEAGIIPSDDWPELSREEVTKVKSSFENQKGVIIYEDSGLPFPVSLNENSGNRIELNSEGFVTRIFSYPFDVTFADPLSTRFLALAIRRIESFRKDMTMDFQSTLSLLDDKKTSTRIKVKAKKLSLMEYDVKGQKHVSSLLYNGRWQSWPIKNDNGKLITLNGVCLGPCCPDAHDESKSLTFSEKGNGSIQGSTPVCNISVPSEVFVSHFSPINEYDQRKLLYQLSTELFIRIAFDAPSRKQETTSISFVSERINPFSVVLDNDNKKVRLVSHTLSNEKTDVTIFDPDEHPYFIESNDKSRNSLVSTNGLRIGNFAFEKMKNPGLTPETYIDLLARNLGNPMQDPYRWSVLKALFKFSDLPFPKGDKMRDYWFNQENTFIKNLKWLTPTETVMASQISEIDFAFLCQEILRKQGQFNKQPIAAATFFSPVVYLNNMPVGGANTTWIVKRPDGKLDLYAIGLRGLTRNGFAFDINSQEGRNEFLTTPGFKSLKDMLVKASSLFNLSETEANTLFAFWDGKLPIIELPKNFVRKSVGEICN